MILRSIGMIACGLHALICLVFADGPTGIAWGWALGSSFWFGAAVAFLCGGRL